MTTTADLPVIALVTAYNEEVTVREIVTVLTRCPSLSRVQVVDDGSTDGTAEQASVDGVRVISLPQRVPVGQAIMHHLVDLQEDCLLLWCDADLVGLRPDYIETLIARYRAGDVGQSLSSRGLPLGWPGWLRCAPLRRGWTRLFGPISGERVIRKSDFEGAISLAGKLEWSEMMRGYGIVLFLNWYCQAYGKGSVITYFDQLRQRQKYEKWGKRSSVEMVAEWVQFGRTWFKIRWHAPRIRRLQAREATSAVMATGGPAASDS